MRGVRRYIKREGMRGEDCRGRERKKEKGGKDSNVEREDRQGNEAKGDMRNLKESRRGRVAEM